MHEICRRDSTHHAFGRLGRLGRIDAATRASGDHKLKLVRRFGHKRWEKGWSKSPQANNPCYGVHLVIDSCYRAQVREVSVYG